jgi:hypothetical protein
MDGAIYGRPTTGEFGHMQRRAGGSPQPESPTTAAIYIRTLAEELAQIAKRHRLESLRYILDMVRLEADQVAKGSVEGGNDSA